MNGTRRRRRWWIVGLLSLAVGCAWLGLAVWLFQCREALRLRLEIEQLSGRVEVESAGPTWLHGLVDPRYFERVVSIQLVNANGINDAWLKSFRDLESLAFYHVRLEERDLAHLGTLERLRTVSLMHTSLKGPELGHLAEVRSLTELRLGGVTDEMMPHLAGCGKLRVLAILASPELTDQGLARLPPLPHLRQLQLAATATTSRGVQALQERFPLVEIVHVSSF